jgi:hypothetical protein
MLGVLLIQGWIIWIHEKLQLDPLRLVCVRLVNLVHLLLLGQKRNGGRGFLCTEGGKAVEDLENLLMAIVLIEILQQKCDLWKDDHNLWLSSILDYFWNRIMYPNLVKHGCNMIQIISMIVTSTKIVIHHFDHGKYGTYF